MKHLTLELALFALLAGCTYKTKPPAPPPSQDHTLTLNWNQSFANNPPCSSTVVTSCISGFNTGTLTGTTPTQLHNDPAGVCSGATQPEACTTTYNAQLPIGSITFYVETTFVDQNGAAGVTARTTTASPVAVAADTPSSLTVTVK